MELIAVVLQLYREVTVPILGDSGALAFIAVGGVLLSTIQFSLGTAFFPLTTSVYTEMPKIIRLGIPFDV